MERVSEDWIKTANPNYVRLAEETEDFRESARHVTA